MTDEQTTSSGGPPSDAGETGERGATDAPATKPRPTTHTGSLDAIRGIKLPPLPSRPGHPSNDGAAQDADHVETGRTQRGERQAAIRARRRNTLVFTGIAIGAILVVLLAAGAIVLLREPATTKVLAQGTSLPVKSGAAKIPDAPAVSTPQFARLKHMPIYLPVDPGRITGVAFHQSAYGRSYHMVSLVPTVDRQTVYNQVKAGKKYPIASAITVSQGIDERSGRRVVESTWKGSVVRLLRSGRSGAADSAVDCGAKAGTTVVAPVTGTVERIRSYKLYGRYPDFEIHIKPDGLPEADLVVIHVQDLVVSPGDRVIGGVTPIAHVRLLSKFFEHQLREYTGDPGDHTHIQFNWPKSDSTPSG